MSTIKTCPQKHYVTRGPRKGLETMRYLPHVVPAWSESGYATCASCGCEVYVGQGPMDPYASQVEQGEYVRRYG